MVFYINAFLNVPIRAGLGESTENVWFWRKTPSLVLYVCPGHLGPEQEPELSPCQPTPSNHRVTESFLKYWTKEVRKDLFPQKPP